MNSVINIVTFNHINITLKFIINKVNFTMSIKNCSIKHHQLQERINYGPRQKPPLFNGNGKEAAM